jgi:hypothetical protein
MPQWLNIVIDMALSVGMLAACWWVYRSKGGGRFRRSREIEPEDD